MTETETKLAELRAQIDAQRERVENSQYLYALAAAASRRGDWPTYQRRLQEALAALRNDAAEGK